jgi:hypothetical protein
MKNSIEIVLLSADHRNHTMIVEWLSENVLPMIVQQEHDTEKIILKTLTDTPAIYLS